MQSDNILYRIGSPLFQSMINTLCVIAQFSDLTALETHFHPFSEVQAKHKLEI